MTTAVLERTDHNHCLHFTTRRASADLFCCLPECGLTIQSGHMEDLPEQYTIGAVTRVDCVRPDHPLGARSLQV